MNTEIIISIAASVLGTMSLAFSWYCFSIYRGQRSYIEVSSERIAELKNSLETNNEILEINKTYMSDQARRIAWLETRVRRPGSKNTDVLSAQVIERDSKPTITEKRHRVLTLASQGMDIESISSTTGMMPGEVELILNLNRQSPAYI
ncbi:MAG: hypothetical protein HKN25_04520 [Pyrinomonadaceae bacterium]|nr:hypothetical protein [Pyrinomonadaceae bacterium]